MKSIRLYISKKKKEKEKKKKEGIESRKYTPI